MAVGKNERAIASQRHHSLFHAPDGELAGSVVRLRTACDDLHLVLVDLQDVGVSQDVAFVCPVDGEDILSAHLAQVTLCVDRYASLLCETFHHLG